MSDEKYKCLKQRNSSSEATQIDLGSDDTKTNDYKGNTNINAQDLKQWQTKINCVNAELGNIVSSGICNYPIAFYGSMCQQLGRYSQYFIPIRYDTSSYYQTPAQDLKSQITNCMAAIAKTNTFALERQICLDSMTRLLKLL